MQNSNPMALSPGARLGPYEIASRIGTGGMGEVYKARDTRLDRTVAIKVLPPDFATDPDRRQRFEHEARTVAALEHPHICVLHDVGHSDGVDYIVMEHLEGETVAERLAKGPLPIDHVFRLATQIASALHKAHRQGITHRDLKPANVMLTKEGAKLLDFGLAKQHQTVAVAGFSQLPTIDKELTAEGTILGTLQYMAPEQLEGKDVDPRTDVFAFGALVYEMATGRKAFSGGSQASLISAIMSSEPPPISTLQPVVPDALDRVVRRCLAKDPEDRWQTMRDIELELMSIGQQSASGSIQGVATPPRRRSLVAVLAIATIALAALVLYRLPWAREERSLRLSVPLPPAVIPSADDPFPTISPDGRYLAFLAASETSFR
jgi:serine/threonine protein kinase